MCRSRDFVFATHDWATSDVQEWCPRLVGTSDLFSFKETLLTRLSYAGQNGGTDGS